MAQNSFFADEIIRNLRILALFPNIPFRNMFMLSMSRGWMGWWTRMKEITHRQCIHSPCFTWSMNIGNKITDFYTLPLLPEHVPRFFLNHFKVWCT